MWRESGGQRGNAMRDKSDDITLLTNITQIVEVSALSGASSGHLNNIQ